MQTARSHERPFPLKLALLLPLAALLGLAALQPEAEAPRAAPGASASHRRAFDRADQEITKIGQVLRIPDIELRSRQEAVLGASVPIEEIPTILGRLSDTRLASLYSAILTSRWTAADPEAAAAWIESECGARSRAVLLAQVAGTWADNDETAAMVWARNLGDQAEREIALAEIARVIGSHNPALALELAGEQDRGVLALECLRDWAMQSPEDAAEWALRHSSAEQRSSAVIEVAMEWASQDAAAAAGFAIEGMADSEQIDGVIVAVISRAVSADLPLLREWVDSFPAGSLKDLSRAELTRIERLLPSAPASLPGEDVEDRTPVAVSCPPTR